MARFVLLDCRLFTGGSDLSGSSNRVELAAEVEAKDATNYRSDGWSEVMGGLATASIQAGGQWAAGPGEIDDCFCSDIGGRNAWTVCPTDATVGALAYTTLALRAQYQIGDTVGEVAPWTGQARSAWPLVRGVIAHPPGTARTSSGTGTALQLGAVPAGRRLYAALHVLSVAGTSTPTLTAQVEADSEEAFGDDPQTVASFAAATGLGGQIVRTTGDPITGPWYRLTWTITGSDPSFMLAAALGIH